MTYDESNPQITMGLCGRTVDHVIRAGRELHFVTTDGHAIVLAADVNGDIHFVRRDVKIVLPNIGMLGELGRF